MFRGGLDGSFHNPVTNVSGAVCHVSSFRVGCGVRLEVRREEKTMKSLIAILVLGAVLFAAVPAMAREANLEGIDENLSALQVWWPLQPRFDVRYPGHILISDVEEV